MTVIDKVRGLVEGFVKKSGHATQTTCGNVYLAGTQRDSEFFDKEEIVASNILASDISKALSGIESDIAIGYSKENDTREIFASDDLIESSDASKLVQDFQKRLNEYNDKKNNLIIVFNHDDFVRYKANHPSANLKDYIKVTAEKVAKDTGNEHLLAGKGDVTDIVTKNVAMGDAQDAAFSLSDDVKSKGTRISIIVPGDMNKNLTREGLMMEVPAAKRLIKEMGLKDEDLKGLVFHHEEGHSIDSPKVEPTNDLRELYIRSLQEKKADLNMVKRMYERGTPEVGKFWTYWRNKTMSESIRSHAYKAAALEGRIPGVFDKESLEILLEGQAKKEKKKPKFTSKIEQMFEVLGENAETLAALGDVGMNVAYNTAPIMTKFMEDMETKPEFKEKIMGMKAKEFDKFASEYLKENDIGFNRFSKQVVDTASIDLGVDANGQVVLALPKNEDIYNVFIMDQKLNAQMGVIPDELYTFQIEKNKKINDSVNSYIHASKGGFFFGDPKKTAMSEQEYAGVTKFFDGFYRKVERENIRNGGDEVRAFDTVAIAEKNRIAKSAHPYKRSILDNMDRTIMNYQEETKLKVNATTKVRGYIDEAEVSDISDLTGEKLVVTHIENQIAKLDSAEKILRQISGSTGKSFDPKASQNAKFAKDMEYAFDDIIKKERLAQALSSKIKEDDTAKEVIGASEIIRSKITKKAGGEFPSWVADFMVATTKGAPTWKMKSLISRLDEKRRLLAVEVVENGKLSEELQKANPQLKQRLEHIVDMTDHTFETKTVERDAMAEIRVNSVNDYSISPYVKNTSVETKGTVKSKSTLNESVLNGLKRMSKYGGGR